MGTDIRTRHSTVKVELHFLLHSPHQEEANRLGHCITAPAHYHTEVGVKPRTHLVDEELVRCHHARVVLCAKPSCTV